MSSGKVIHGSSLSRDKRVATARLLNSTAIRLVSFYESKNPSFSSTSSSSEEKNGIEKVLPPLIRSISKIALSIVSIASSSHSGDVNDPVGIEVRDAAYGVLCSTVRCPALLPLSIPLSSSLDKVDDANIVASGGNGGILLVTRPVLYYKTENALIGKNGVRGLNS